MTRHDEDPLRSESIDSYLRETRIIAVVALLALVAGIVSDEFESQFWGRHALLAGLTASVITVVLTVAQFQAWTDNDGNPEEAVSFDKMLDNVSVYWFTGSITSSMRLYLECAPAGPGPFNAGVIDFPIAASIFPREIFKAPRSWAESLWSDIVYWGEVEHGGHFAARSTL